MGLPHVLSSPYIERYHERLAALGAVAGGAPNSVCIKNAAVSKVGDDAAPPCHPNRRSMRRASLTCGVPYSTRTGVANPLLGGSRSAAP
jgi:hypothetical protein